MADTTTTAYSLTKPEVGASEDTWGTKLNTDLDSLDTIINAIGGKTAAGTLSYADSAKLATTSTGIDVTGTVTADDITLSDADTPTITLTDTTNTLTTFLQSGNSTAVLGTSTAHDIRFQANSTDAIRIANGGDISFYEDTGTTAKFFWDASAESLGIGTTSPSAALEIGSTTTIAGARLTTSAGSDSEIEFINTNSGNHTWAIGQDFSNSNVFSIAYNNAVGASLSSNSKVVINTSGSVGIGTTSPSTYSNASELVVDTGVSGGITVVSDSSSGGYGALYFADGTTGNEQYRGFIQYNHNNAGSVDELLIGTGGSEAMRIDSSGNVKFGPNGEGYINGAAQNTYNSGFNVNTDDFSTWINYSGYQGGTTKFRDLIIGDGKGGRVATIDGSSGNLFLGTTSVFSGSGIVPLVTITGTTGGIGVNSIGSAEVGLATRPSASHNYYAGFFLNNSGNGVGNITVTGSSTAYNTSSDHRLKENVVELTGATTRLKQLKPARFNFIADADTTVDGFLAHEVQSVVPEAITGTHNEVDDDGNPVYQGIDQSKLVPLLVATIKELEARITALENA